MTTKISSSSPEVKTEVIGPKEARYLLQMNTHNRNIRQQQVSSMARDMKEHRWVLNGETIKVSDEGALIDGQHRLLAVVESGAMVPMLVVRGLPAKAQDSVDIGSKRSLRDQLQLAGNANAANLSAAARFCWFMELDGKPKVFGITPTIAELRDWIDIHPALLDSLMWGERANRSPIRYTTSVAAGLHFMMADISSGADAFWNALIDGTDADPTSGVHVLREQLIRDLGSSRPMGKSDRVALTIKAWNAWQTGKKVQLLVYRSTGVGAEPYPVLIGDSMKPAQKETK